MEPEKDLQTTADVQSYDNYQEEDHVMHLDPNNVESPELQKNINKHRLRDFIKNKVFPQKLPVYGPQPEQPKKKYRFIVIVVILITLAFFITFMFMMKSGDHFVIGNNEETVEMPDGTITTKQITGPELNAAYFTMTTLSSVGYGDICPKSVAAKILTSVLQLFAFSVSVGAVYVISDKSIIKKVKNIKFA